MSGDNAQFATSYITNTNVSFTACIVKYNLVVLMALLLPQPAKENTTLTHNHVTLHGTTHSELTWLDIL